MQLLITSYLTPHGPFIALYVYPTDAIFVFLIIATGAGVFTAKLGMPALVGEIFTGFLLGPPLADFVPFPEALVLVGQIGLIMLMLEAGVELDVAQLRETGVRYVFTIHRFECRSKYLTILTPMEIICAKSTCHRPDGYDPSPPCRYGIGHGLRSLVDQVCPCRGSIL